MPTRPKTYRPPGAPTPQQQQRRYDQMRGTAHERGYGAQWQKARLLYLAEHPLCVECARAGAVRPATVVDHVEPHRGDPVKFWDVGNWQALCKPHHDAKTARGR